jgi:hypothetical protein
MTQDDVLQALGRARSEAECRAALRQADAWCDDHPDDDDVRMAMEGTLMILELWELPLDVWPQSERDALMAEGKVD